MFAFIPPPPHLALSLLELGLSVLALLFFSLRFAHVKVAKAKLSLLDELQAEGLLSGDAHRDYRTLTRLIHTMSPAIAMRSEFWVGFYAISLKAAAVVIEQAANREFRRLTAHQAGRYQIAIGRINALRTDPAL